ncbi:hypothetical protein AAKU55_004659 [Oxalobacteraceae bacterium GrIS 1.11]
MQFKPRALGVPLVLIAPALFSGCANFTPYVLPLTDDACSIKANDEICKTVPSLTAAINNIGLQSKYVARNLGGASNVDSSMSAGLGGVMSSTATRKVIDVATFGLVTALGVQAAHGGPTKNLALGAAAMYAAGTLFASPATDSVYLTTYNNLVCISDKGESLLASFISAKARTSSESYSFTILKSAKECLDSSLNDFTAADVTAAGESYSAAQAAIDRVIGSDAELAEKLRLSANNVLAEMNRQLLANSPSLDAISKAAKSESSISSALLAKATPAPSPAADSADSLSHSDQIACKFKKSDLSQAKSQFDSIALSVASALNYVGDLTTSCTATQAIPIKTLAVQQSTVDINAGKTFNLVISGGRPPYSYTWSGATPDAMQLTAQMMPESSVLAISATDTVPDKSFTLQISDAAVIASTISVSVATHAKPAPIPAPSPSLTPGARRSPSRAPPAPRVR